jgi:hypothetical protein
MLDTKDMQALEVLFAKVHHNMSVMKEEILSTMRSEVVMAKEEILSTMHRELREVRDDVIDVMNDGVLPQIEQHNIRITRLERMQRQAA